MSLEAVGLLCIVMGLIALPYALLYAFARSNDARRAPSETIPFDPFSIFSRVPVWRTCLRCHTYDYSTNTLCHAHAFPAPLLPLTRARRYRVRRMSGVCIHTEQIAHSEQEAFERFALTLMAAHPGMIWTPPEGAGLYHLDACVANDN